MFTALVLILAAAPAASRAMAVAPLRLQHIVVALPSRSLVHVTLHGAPLAGKLTAGLTSQWLALGAAQVPLPTPVDVTVDPGETRAEFDLRLRDVPEAVLAEDPNRMPVLWEGLESSGAVGLAIAGTVDLGDRGDVEVPLADLYRAYATMSDFTVTPGLSAVTVHGLLGLFNPFGFDVVVTGLELHVKVGTQAIMDAKRPGFRLRAGQSSDVLIEQDVALADVAGGMTALLRGEPPVLDGVLVLRTPKGDRPIPLQAQAPN